MIIYFIRHGQTADNLRGIIQGHIDTPLNDHGRKEARLLADRLKDVKFDEAWSSSLSRARETAEIVLQHHPGLPLRTDPGLMERCLGSLQGSRWTKGHPLPDDVEATDVFRKRITDWFLSFLATQQTDAASALVSDSPGGTAERTILVASHGAYLTALLSILLHLPFCFAYPDDLDIKQSCHNTSIMKVQLFPRSDISNTKGDEAVWKEVLSRKEDIEAGEGMKKGQKMQERSEWVGMIQSWADVKHLERKGEAVDVGVADDLGEAAR